MTDKWIALGFSLLILGQAYLVRRFVGTWLFPACLFGLFWFALTVIPLVLLLQVPIEPYAVGFILLCCLAFSATSLFFDWKPAFQRNSQKQDADAIYGSRFLKRAFHGLVAASLVLVVLNLLTQGLTLHDLVFNLFASAQIYSHLRYSEGLTSVVIERWSIVCVYLTVTIGGLRFSSGTRRGRRFIMVLSFLPPVFIAITQSAMWHFLLSLVLFYSGILVYRISTGKLFLIEKGRAKWLAIYAGLVFLIVVVTALSRGLYASDDSGLVLQALTNRMASYSSGHLYAFADWFAFSLGRPSELSYAREASTEGFYTFATLFKLVGSQRVLPIGVFEDYYSYSNLLTTNVFTMFRGLIQDFGMVGSVIFMALSGLLFHGAFFSMLSRKRPVFAVVAFVLMMSYFYSSFVVSILGSNIVYYVTFAGMWVILSVNKLMTLPYKIGVTG